MKTFSKITVQAVFISMCLSLFSVQVTWSAEYKLTVHSAVENARSNGIPEETLTRFLAYALDNHISGDETIQFLIILIRVQEAGFSLSTFVEKYQEGLAKKINPEIIEKALKQHLNDYLYVRELIENNYNDQIGYSEIIIKQFVESMDYGNTRGQLRVLFDWAPGIPPEMLSIAAKNKALLRQISFDDETIEDILFTGLTNKSLTPRWSLLYKVVSAAKRKEIPSDQVVKAVKSVLIQRGDVGDILNNLGFTFRDIRHGPHLDSPPNESEKSQQ